ncbi:MAG: hypothetical protein LBI45_03250 [Bacteroidales bacterium]|jgi:hypothetical protein|nr:hypothetical protein [Bacteroidales bacterium]
MDNNKNQLHALLLMILLFLFTLHFTQYKFNWIKLKPLDGYYVMAENPKFSWNDWFSGSYQEAKDKHLTDHFGFRSFFIRINHQLRFSLFNKAKTAWVTVGKENYLYEENYIKAYYGDDFIGQDSIEQRMYKLKMLQDTLIKLDKKIIVVLAPGKGSFYPEYIPENFHKEKGTTNIEIYRQYLEKWNIFNIDFHRYFIENKEKSQYSFYPQYGIHWSIYSLCVAADSMVRYVEKVNNIDMPHIYWKKINVTQPKRDDIDISRAMNLLFSPKSFGMAYPDIKYESDEGKTKPSLVVIADSFYWGIYNRGWSRLFSNDQFWYYYKEIYTSNQCAPPTIEEMDLRDEIMKTDIFIILSTDANLPNLGWGFIESAYCIFF